MKNRKLFLGKFKNHVFSLCQLWVVHLPHRVLLIEITKTLKCIRHNFDQAELHLYQNGLFRNYRQTCFFIPRAKFKAIGIFIVLEDFTKFILLKPVILQQLQLRTTLTNMSLMSLALLTLLYLIIKYSSGVTNLTIS